MMARMDRGPACKTGSNEALSTPRTRSAAVPSRSGHEDGTGLKWFGIAGSLNPLRVRTPALRRFENGSNALTLSFRKLTSGVTKQQSFRRVSAMNRVRVPANKMVPLIILFALLGVACSSLAQTTPGRAEVRSVKGTATWSTNGAPAKPLKVGTVLRTGATITTGTNSNVDLFLGISAGVIRIAESSTLSLDLLQITETGADKKVEVQLDLPDGEMYFNVNKLSKASRYEIKMPTGVAGIRGTKGSFNARPGSTKPPIVLLDGTLVFIHVRPNGQVTTHTLKAPPAVSFTVEEGVKDAPLAVVQVIVAQVESVTKTATPRSTPPPKQNTQPMEPVLTNH